MELWDYPILFPELPSKSWLNFRVLFNKFDKPFHPPSFSICLSLYLSVFSSLLLCVCLSLSLSLSVLPFLRRFDEEFLSKRRLQLQEYLRTLVKIESIVELSFVLQQFLEINHRPLYEPNQLNDQLIAQIAL
jgi:hypothetical protein